MITARTQMLAVLGDPVAHSLSPTLQNGWIQDHGLDALYGAVRITDAAAFKTLRAIGLKGANVTVPHKEAAAAACDRLDETAKTLGVANVLRWEADGSLSGFSTDGHGITASLDESAPAWREGKTALVIGAGGAGRAAARALAQAGLKVRIVNRTQAKAQALADLIGGDTAPWEDLPKAFAGADVIINGTKIGLNGADMDWPLAAAPARAIVLDAVYAPLETGLLRAARARGLVGVDGLGMLLHQGAESFRLWFGIAPDVGLGRARLLQALQASE